MMPIWSTACLDWKERIVNRQSLVTFDALFPDEAEAALSIFRDLILVDVPGRPTIGECCLPWVYDLPRILFGSYDAEGISDPANLGRRLIRYFLLHVAKKNTKSTLAAGVMVTALLRNWRESGEFYILAPTKEVADNSFFPARDMIRADEELLKLLHVQDSQRLITHRTTGAFLKVAAADSETVSGKKTIGLLIDELWLFGQRANAESMIREAEGGLNSRPEGFVIYLTTQSPKPPAGIFDQKLKDFRDIRDGKLVDPQSLPIIYEFPEEMIKSKAYEKPENWFIPNPNWGKSVDPNFLIGKRAEAARSGKASLIDWDAKFLNVQAGMSQRADGWAGAELWDRGSDPSLTLDAILDRSEVVTMGLDGGGLDDLLGIGVVGREKGRKRWLGWAHALISTIGLYRRKANINEYRKFLAAGDLTIFRFHTKDAEEAESDPDVAALLAEFPPQISVEGELPFDIRFVVDLVELVRDGGLLAQVGVDAAGIGAIVDALAGIDITQDAETLDAVRQGIGLMGAYKTVERKLGDRTFLHCGSELLNWCVGNARVVLTTTASRIAREEAGFGKIDPLIALFNAAHLMTLNPESGGRSVFDTMDDGEDPQSDAESQASLAEEAMILRDPQHPRFEEMRERFNARLAANDRDDLYA
ncbi:terminase large subunit [Bradyrhizobium sp. 150]|uniref:terminase large subunit domain-containing protein n=1 Tax=Bradyrhizobium sp. 150 TaxID=2782625 RepID=UPI001FF9280C|nr:terminase large subunit [Bradyrhizobium sp. 150]MCK1676624.1 terminase large subunit [Bradyrhizobium sp. 150]